MLSVVLRYPPVFETATLRLFLTAFPSINYSLCAYAINSCLLMPILMVRTTAQDCIVSAWSRFFNWKALFEMPKIDVERKLTIKFCNLMHWTRCIQLANKLLRVELKVLAKMRRLIKDQNNYSNLVSR